MSLVSFANIAEEARPVKSKPSSPIEHTLCKDNALCECKSKDPLLHVKQTVIERPEGEIHLTDTKEAWLCFINSLSDEEKRQWKIRENSASRRSLMVNLNCMMGEDDSDLSDEEASLKLIKVELVPSKLPDYLKYEYTFTQKHDTDCTYCNNNVANSLYHPCRICNRVFHEHCVGKRGYLSSELSKLAVLESRTVVGWSCPECESIFNLLSDNEKRWVMDVYEAVAGEDGVIDIEEFVKMQRTEYEDMLGAQMPNFRIKLERELFEKIDRDGTGFIEWWEFMPYMAVRILSKRQGTELIDYLTAREVDCFKMEFVYLDDKKKTFLPVSLAQRAFVEWFTMKVKPTPTVKVDGRWHGGFLTKKSNDQYEKDNAWASERQRITWDSYLERCALHVIAARPNTIHQKPFIPPMPNFAGDVTYDSDDDEVVVSLDESAPDDTHLNERFATSGATNLHDYISAKLEKSAKDRRMRERLRDES